MPDGLPFGPYLIIKRLAQGGMAEVFLARSRAEEVAPRLVVLKRMLPVFMSDPEIMRMFLDEARIAAQLAHPYLIQVFDVGRAEQTLYIAMDYVHGVTIAEMLRVARSQGKPVPWTLAVRLACYVCEALQYAHELRSMDGQALNLVHRDVTPSNVMVTYAGAPKLVDFGIARASQRLTETQPGTIKGKLLYAAPEQYRGAIVDARADIYGLALCLYELLVGHHPFADAVAPYDAANAVLTRVPPSVALARPDVPKALAEVIHRALAKKPDDRPASALLLRQGLEASLMDARAVVGMPELAQWLALVFPGRAAFTPVREDEADADAVTISLQDAEAQARREGGSTAPLDDFKRAALLSSLEQAPSPVLSQERPTSRARPVQLLDKPAPPEKPAPTSKMPSVGLPALPTAKPAGRGRLLWMTSALLVALAAAATYYLYVIRLP